MYESLNGLSSNDDIQVQDNLGVHVYSFPENTELDIATCPWLREKLLQSVDCRDCVGVVIDMNGITFIDGLALGLLTVAHRSIRNKGGDLILDFRSRQKMDDKTPEDRRSSLVYKIFEITKLNTFLTTYLE